MSKISLIDTCNITTGKLDANAAVENGDYPYFTCAPEPLRIDKYEFEGNVILLAGNNASGNFHCQRFNGKFNAYQRTYVITAKKGYDIDYIYYNLKINLEHFKKISQGSQTKFLTMTILEGFLIEDIDLKKQKKMIRVVSLIDKKIELNRITINDLEQIVKTIYDYWFLQFEFPIKDGNLYKSSGGKMIWNEEMKKEIPEGWKYKKIVEIENNIVTGKTPSTKDEGNFNGNIPFITIDDIRQGLYVANTIRTLSEKGASSQSKKYIPKDTICVTCIATVGLVGITTKDSQTNQQINSIVCENKNNLYYLVNAIKDYFEYSNGAKSGNIFDNMNKEDFASIKIIYPTEDVLEKYKEKVEPIYSKIRSCILENEELIKLRDYLLPLLMNGQIGF